MDRCFPSANYSWSPGLSCAQARLRALPVSHRLPIEIYRRFIAVDLRTSTSSAEATRISRVQTQATERPSSKLVASPEHAATAFNQHRDKNVHLRPSRRLDTVRRLWDPL